MNIIVSLTTTPSRFQYLLPTLESLTLQQILKPNQVLVFVSSAAPLAPQNFPDTVTVISDCSSSSSALTSGLAHFTARDDNSVLITVHDDILYDPRFLERFLYWCHQESFGSVLGNCGCIVGKFPFWLEDVDNPFELVPVDIIHGFAGVCYPVKLFSNDIMENSKNPTQSNSRQEDIWMGHVLEQLKIPQKIIPRGNRIIRRILPSEIANNKHDESFTKQWQDWKFLYQCKKIHHSFHHLSNYNRAHSFGYQLVFCIIVAVLLVIGLVLLWSLVKRIHHRSTFDISSIVIR